LLRRLPERNAHTIFGALAEELAGVGVELLPASSFMEQHLAPEGVLTARRPDDREQADIELGFRVAEATSSLDIGQTVVVKQGTILAVEAFEGTDETILRAGRLGGKGAVVVKTAKPGHDMRFDIPVVGDRTLRNLAKAGVSVLACQAGRTILLDRDAVVARADRTNISLVALPRGSVQLPLDSAAAAPPSSRP
jgi:DUF1009 family protein